MFRWLTGGRRGDHVFFDFSARSTAFSMNCQATMQCIYSGRLQGESTENGSFIEFGWRLSRVFAEKVRKWLNRRLSRIRKARHGRAFLLLKKEIL
jgi:hypothetical protein